MPTLEEEYKQYQGAQGVNQMYDAQKASQLAGLESAYQQNLSNAQVARDAIPRQYQERANDLAVQYERQRRNLNQQANANGLNTGAGSQMQLSLGSNYQRDYGGIRTAQQQAIDQAERGIRDLQAAYNSSVQQAVADNDFRRTQALLADYQQRYQQQLQTAQNLAQWGDFRGYNGIPGYSNESISNMQNVWQASNPDLAFRTGRITAEQYYQMTGQWPAGYTPSGSNGGGGSYPQTPGSNGSGTFTYTDGSGKSSTIKADDAAKAIAGASTPAEAEQILQAYLDSPYYQGASEAELNSIYNAAVNAGVGGGGNNGGRFAGSMFGGNRGSSGSSGGASSSRGGNDAGEKTNDTGLRTSESGKDRGVSSNMWFGPPEGDPSRFAGNSSNRGGNLDGEIDQSNRAKQYPGQFSGVLPSSPNPFLYLLPVNNKQR